VFSHISKEHFTFIFTLNLEEEGNTTYKTSVTTFPAVHCHVPEYVNPQLYLLHLKGSPPNKTTLERKEIWA
jgi:hypothetical protein